MQISNLKSQIQQGWALAAGGLAVLVALTLVTHNQVAHWRNSESIFTHCLEVTGRNSIAHNNLGAALAKQARFDEARAHFLAALEIRPGDADVLHNLGIALVEQGHFDEGMAYLRQAATVKPEFVAGYSKLAAVLDAQGKTAQAVVCYREYLQSEPNGLEACNNLAWILATHPDAGLRDGKEAVRLAEHACELTGYQQTLFIGTLAAAYAEAGRFPDAVGAAEKAVALATAAGQTPLAERNRHLLELYRSGKPFRDTAN